MYWNHRVVQIVDPKFPEEVFFEVQEVYYNDKDQPCGYCDPCVGGENLDEIKLQIERFAECLNKPILISNVDFNHEYDAEVV